MTGRSRRIAPQIGTDEWKTFVADAAARTPSRRSDAEKEVLALMEEGYDAVRTGKFTGVDEWLDHMMASHRAEVDVPSHPTP